MVPHPLVVYGGGKWQATASASGSVSGWGRMRWKIARGRLMVLLARRALPALRALAARDPAHEGYKFEYSFRKNTANQPKVSVAVQCKATILPQQLQLASKRRKERTSSERDFHTKDMTVSAVHSPRKIAKRQKTSISKNTLHSPDEITLETKNLPKSTHTMGPMKCNTGRVISFDSEDDVPLTKRFNKVTEKPLDESNLARDYQNSHKKLQAHGSRTELVIDERDVEMLNMYLQNKLPDEELLEINNNNKMIHLNKINPLVHLEKCPRITQMLDAQEQIRLVNFASQLGLAPVSEASFASRRYWTSRHERKSYVAKANVKIPTKKAKEAKAANKTLKERNDKIRQKKLNNNTQVRNNTGKNKKHDIETDKYNNNEHEKAQKAEGSRQAVLSKEKDDPNKPVEAIETNIDANKLASKKPKVLAKSKRPALREYSDMEDQAIVSCLTQWARASQVTGNRLWRKLQGCYPSLVGHGRTWQSLRHRYLRYILPRLTALAPSAAHQAPPCAAAATGVLKGRKLAARRNSTFALPPRGAASRVLRFPPPTPPVPRSSNYNKKTTKARPSSLPRYSDVTRWYVYLPPTPASNPRYTHRSIRLALSSPSRREREQPRDSSPSPGRQDTPAPHPRDTRRSTRLAFKSPSRRKREEPRDSSPPSSSPSRRKSEEPYDSSPSSSSPSHRKREEPRDSSPSSSSPSHRKREEPRDSSPSSSSPSRRKREEPHDSSPSSSSPSRRKREKPRDSSPSPERQATPAPHPRDTRWSAMLALSSPLCRNREKPRNSSPSPGRQNLSTQRVTRSRSVIKNKSTSKSRNKSGPSPRRQSPIGHKLFNKSDSREWNSRSRSAITARSVRTSLRSKSTNKHRERLQSASTERGREEPRNSSSPPGRQSTPAPYPYDIRWSTRLALSRPLRRKREEPRDSSPSPGRQNLSTQRVTRSRSAINNKSTSKSRNKSGPSPRRQSPIGHKPINKSDSRERSRSTITTRSVRTSLRSKSTNKHRERLQSASTERGREEPRDYSSSPGRQATPAPHPLDTRCSTRIALCSPLRRKREEPRDSSSSPERQATPAPHPLDTRCSTRIALSSPLRRKREEPRDSSWSPERQATPAPHPRDTRCSTRLALSSPLRRKREEPRDSSSSPERQAAPAPLPHNTRRSTRLALSSPLRRKREKPRDSSWSPERQLTPAPHPRDTRRSTRLALSSPLRRKREKPRDSSPSPGRQSLSTQRVTRSRSVINNKSTSKSRNKSSPSPRRQSPIGHKPFNKSDSSKGNSRSRSTITSRSVRTSLRSKSINKHKERLQSASSERGREQVEHIWIPKFTSKSQILIQIEGLLFKRRCLLDEKQVVASTRADRLTADARDFTRVLNEATHQPRVMMTFI